MLAKRIILRDTTVEDRGLGKRKNMVHKQK